VQKYEGKGEKVSWIRPIWGDSKGQRMSVKKKGEVPKPIKKAEGGKKNWDGDY